MEVVKLENILKEVNGKTLFKCKEISVNRKQKIAIIGNNGSGKTTLLNMINNVDTEYSGRIKVNGKIAYVKQINISNKNSGGEALKNKIIAAFASDPDILCLDEPTSNLDEENLKWLDEQLSNFENTLIYVSHDRLFLEKHSNVIWFIENEEVKSFIGNFSRYEEFTKKKREKDQEKYQAYLAEKERLTQVYHQRLTEADKLKKGNKKKLSISDKKSFSRTDHGTMQKKKAKAAKAIKTRLEKLEEISPVERKKTIHFLPVTVPEKKESVLLSLNDYQVRRQEKVLLENVFLKLRAGEVVVINGPNGSGKTTFLKSIYFNNSQKEIYLSPVAQKSYFAQDLDHLLYEESIFKNIQQFSKQNDQFIYDFLGALGIPYSRLKEPVKNLSGGEKVKVQLAQTLLADGNILLLDEPTNFLDLRAIDALQSFLINYNGAVILVAHNRDFVNKVATRQLRIKNKLLVDETNHIERADFEDLSYLEFKYAKDLLDPDIPIETLKKEAETIKRIKNQKILNK